jgi:outer membrane assembly lipoprotein YfgL
LGRVEFALQAKAVAGQLALANSAGLVTLLDASTGQTLWQADVGGAISAGVGFDGHWGAVVTVRNELVVIEDGKIAWRNRLGAQVLTAPLVAGARVFVLGADRSLSAFDAKTGRKLWSIQRPGEPLVLRQSGVLMAFGNTLVAGFSGHLLGFDPMTATVLWDAALSTPRGGNDIERLADMIGGVARSGDALCMRSFQSTVGCVDGKRGAVTWRKTANGSVGLATDGETVFGVEDDGRLLAWSLANGDVRWTNDSLRYRKLSAPVNFGRAVVVADDTGLIHLLSRSDGSAITRLSTDGSGFAVAPVEVNGTLVMVTRQGSVLGFKPQ